MRVVNLIQRKRDGGDLAREEINFFLQEYVAGNIPDYQASAFLMAVFFSGLTEQELLDWTESLLSMAPALDLSDLPGPKMGKHSTGGVGDKTSLIVGPLVSCTGITVPIIAGQGLAHTGGTLDKVQSIPGFNTHLKAQEFKEVLRKAGLGIIGQTDDLTPADKKLSSLRDTSGSVESIPLIAISILANELAGGIEGLVVDVKTGSGALVKKMTDSRRLAQTLVSLGKRLGKKVISVITDMDQPLGNAVGNALEVMEAVEAMRGAGPADLVETSLELAARMVSAAQPDRTLESVKEQMFQLLNDGSALQKFRQLIEAQGGNPQIMESFELLPNASAEFVISSPRAGYVSRISADDIGQAVMLLGAGREKMNAHIDAAVGIVLEHKVGDRIQAGERLCTIYYNEEAHLEEASQMVEDAFHISSTQPEARPLIHEIIQ
ncbi:MAG: thymidine phosphorylase [Acidobacteria bacterium]|nr:thymidine phosphorylase [Acidobacteriota bacterium]